MYTVTQQFVPVLLLIVIETLRNTWPVDGAEISVLVPVEMLVTGVRTPRIEVKETMFGLAIVVY
jgi:hypothetical protein